MFQQQGIENFIKFSENLEVTEAIFYSKFIIPIL